MMKIKYFVIISREGNTEVYPWENKEDARKFYDKWSENWTESYICEIIKGPFPECSP